MKILHLTLAVVLIGLGVLLFVSCGTPVTVGVVSDYGAASYSEKGGLVLEVDAAAIARRYMEPPTIVPEK